MLRVTWLRDWGSLCSGPDGASATRGFMGRERSGSALVLGVGAPPCHAMTPMDPVSAQPDRSLAEQLAAEQAAKPDQLRLMKQIHDEAQLLRAVAHEADAEVATIVAATRRKRDLERLRRYAARSTAREGELGEDR